MRRASDMAPALRAGALDTEKRRRPLPEQVAALKSAGIISAAQPVCYGGLGLDVDIIFEVAAELVRGRGR